MSATKAHGAYEISEHATWDSDENMYQVKMGIKSKKGLIIHYIVMGKSKTVARNRATFLAELLTAMRPGTIHQPWEPFTGDYAKEYYDIKLVTGDIVENCYPNAGTFHVLKENGKFAQGYMIEGSTVAEFRLSNYDPFQKHK